MPDSLPKLAVWRQHDLVRIGKLQSPVDILLPMLEKGCTLSRLMEKTSMDYRVLHKYLLGMTGKGMIMLRLDDGGEAGIHVQ